MIYTLYLPHILDMIFKHFGKATKNPHSPWIFPFFMTFIAGKSYKIINAEICNRTSVRSPLYLGRSKINTVDCFKCSTNLQTYWGQKRGHSIFAHHSDIHLSRIKILIEIPLPLYSTETLSNENKGSRKDK